MHRIQKLVKEEGKWRKDGLSERHCLSFEDGDQEEEQASQKKRETLTTKHINMNEDTRRLGVGKKGKEKEERGGYVMIVE